MKLTDVVFYTKSIEQSKEFYKSLGLTIASDRGNYVCFNTNTNVYLSINLADTPAKEKALGGGSISFDVENVFGLSKKLKENNIEFYKEIIKMPFGSVFSILDPDKNKIMFVERS